MALWIRTDGGAIVCVGCAHVGLINTLVQVQSLNDGMRIRAVIGGFHLQDTDESRLGPMIAALKGFDPDIIMPCHRAGENAIFEFRRAFSEKCRVGAAGMVFGF